MADQVPPPTPEAAPSPTGGTPGAAGAVEGGLFENLASSPSSSQSAHIENSSEEVVGMEKVIDVEHMDRPTFDGDFTQFATADQRVQPEASESSVVVEEGEVVEPVASIEPSNTPVLRRGDTVDSATGEKVEGPPGDSQTPPREQQQRVFRAYTSDTQWAVLSADVGQQTANIVAERLRNSPELATSMSPEALLADARRQAFETLRVEQPEIVTEEIIAQETAVEQALLQHREEETPSVSSNATAGEPVAPASPEPAVAAAPTGNETSGEPGTASQPASADTGDGSTKDQGDAALAKQKKIDDIFSAYARRRKALTDRMQRTPTPEEEEQVAREALRDAFNDPGADTNDELLRQYAGSGIVDSVVRRNESRTAAESRTNAPKYSDVRPDFEEVEQFFAKLPPEVQTNSQLKPLLLEFLKTGNYTRESIQGLHNEIQDLGEQILREQSAGLEKEQALQLARSTVREVLLMAYGTDRIVDNSGRLIMMTTRDGKIVPIDAVTYVINMTNRPDYNPNLGDAIETLLVRKLGNKTHRAQFAEELPVIEKNIQMLRYLEYKDRDPKAIGEDIQRRAQALEAIEKKYKDHPIFRWILIILGKLLHKATEKLDTVGAGTGS